MKIEVINNTALTTFAELKLGDMFQKNRCIAMKILCIGGGYNAVIIRESDAAGAITPGNLTFWHDSDSVVPVKKITIET